jgi:predicted O-methyltransferase YrrM
MNFVQISFIAIFVTLLIVILFMVGKLIKHKSLYPLLPFRYDFRKRRITFKRTLELLDLINAKVIIETGTSRHGLNGARSQGAATIVFGKWAQKNNAILHSVDISEESVKVAQNEVEAHALNSNVKIHLSDSIEFLKKFEHPVDFLYLDSYDYSDDPEVQLKSQLHHLCEFQVIEDKLHKDSIVLIDDCDLPGGGKGKLAIEYMKENLWVPIIINYQVLLLHKNSLLLTNSR